MKAKFNKYGLYIICSIPELKKIDSKKYVDVVESMKNNNADINDPEYIVKLQTIPFKGTVLELGYKEDCWHIPA